MNINISTDVVGSLRTDNPKSAIDAQMPIDLTYKSDGQGYCYVLQDANLPFLLDIEKKPLLSQVKIEEFRSHRIVKLLARIKKPINPKNSLIVDWFDKAITYAKDIGSNKSGNIKFIHPLPLTLLNVFSIKSLLDVYGSQQKRFLEDLLEFIVVPTLDFVIDKYKVNYIQMEGTALFDGDIHKELVNDEFLIMNKLSSYFIEKNITFGYYAPDVPLPREMPDSYKPDVIRSRLLGLDNAVTWFFFDQKMPNHEFESKLRFIKRHKNENNILSVGVVDSNSEHDEDVDLIVSRVKELISYLNLDNLHIAPYGGFKGVDMEVAVLKMQRLNDIKRMIK